MSYNPALIPQLPNIAALRTVRPDNGASAVQIKGYYGLGTALDSYGGGFFWVNVSDTTSADDGFSIIVDAAGNRWYRSFFGSKINPHMAGAYGDETHNDSTAIQTAINWLSAKGGGALWHPGLGAIYLCNVILAQGVMLTTDFYSHGNLDNSEVIATYKGSSTTEWVIDTPSGLMYACGVDGVNVAGASGATTGGGVRFQNVTGGRIANSHADEFQDQGFLCLAGEANTFDGLFADNCLLNRTRSNYNGAVEIHGTDHYIGRIEAGCSQGTTVTSGGFCCGVAIWAINCFGGEGIVGEFSDIGVFMGGGLNRLSNVRGDTNPGYGLVFGSGSGSNQIANYTTYNNSGSGNNLYDGILDNGQGNQVTSITASQSGTTTLLRYVVNSPTGYAAVSSRGQYGPIIQSNTSGGNAYAGGLVNFDGTGHQGSAIQELALPLVFSSGTPDMTGTKFGVSNSQTLTNFGGGWDGKEIFILSNSGVNILTNNANIQTNTAANKTLTNGLFYHLIFYAGKWHEQGT